MSAPDSEHEQLGEKDGLNEIISQLEEDEEGWAMLPAMGNHSLDDCKCLIRHYIAKIYHKPLQPGWRCSRDRANLRPSPEHYCENLRARVHWTEMVKSPTTFFKVEDLPEGILL